MIFHFFFSLFSHSFKSFKVYKIDYQQSRRFYSEWRNFQIYGNARVLQEFYPHKIKDFLPHSGTSYLLAILVTVAMKNTVEYWQIFFLTIFTIFFTARPSSFLFFG